MINPGQILDNLVVTLGKIADLRALTGGVNQIYAYHDRYPKKVSLRQAIEAMPAGSVMAAWMGTAPGNLATTEVWKHHFSIYLRAGEDKFAGDEAGYYAMYRAILRGNIDGQPAGMSLLYISVQADCLPMDPAPIARETDDLGLDYFCIQVAIPEVGDS